MEAVQVDLIEPGPRCHNTECTNAAPSKCAGCKSVRYCSKTCQRAHWPTHKANCKKAEATASTDVHETGRATNAVRILPGPFSDRESLRRLVKPFQLESYGDADAEKREIMRRLGWGNVVEGRKCYDHKGTDTWYYFIYIDSTQTATATRNEAVEMVTERRQEYRGEFFVGQGHIPVNGDAIWVRSGPVSEVYPKEIILDDVVDTILHYRTHDPRTVWHQRESSRFIRKTSEKIGVDPKSLIYCG